LLEELTNQVLVEIAAELVRQLRARLGGVNLPSECRWLPTVYISC
jgi:hypothetical protein